MEHLHNPHLEDTILSERLKLALVFLIVLSTILVVRLHNLQVVHHDLYLDESSGNRLRVLPIVPSRGKIFDRHGKILATNKLAFRLTLTPEKTQNIAKTLLQLKQENMLSQADIHAFYKRRRHHHKSSNIPLKNNLTKIQAMEFLTNNTLAGLDAEPYFHRIYPSGQASVHALGYVSRMNASDKLLYDRKNYAGTVFVGKTGIEKRYEAILHGNRGTQQIERNVSGKVVDKKIIKNAVAGTDLYLSLDLAMQEKAAELLKGKRGAIVVINVKTGELLTLVSAPTFDANWFVNGISHKNYQQLQTSKNIPQLNRTIQGLYPPGSTIKPMVALAGLEEGAIDNHTHVFCPGYYQLPNVKRKFNDWKRSGHGNIDMQGAIAQSCDVFFYELANRLGIDTMHDNLAWFSFGQKTGIDIPGEQRGVLPSKAWKKRQKNQPWYRGETLIVGIGQGFITVTPLQLAVATAALANKGQVRTPRLLKNTQAPDESIIEVKKPRAKSIPVKNIANWEYVIEGMVKTIYAPKGTARKLRKGLTYTMAGKTGTAQVFGLDAEEKYIAENLEERLRDHALFTGFAPVENPEIAIAVIVENAGSGSSKAAPLARQVMDVYFAQQSANTVAQ